VCGRVYDDTNGDGEYQPDSEAGLAAVSVMLSSPLFSKSVTVSTDANGDYCASLPAGVCVVLYDEG
jgi:hypothetical protein